MSYKSFLTERCNIWRYQEIENEDHVTKQQLLKVYEDVPCRVVMKNSRNIEVQGRVKVIVNYKGHFLIITDIQNGDILELRNTRYKVTEPNPIARHHIEAILNREDEV